MNPFNKATIDLVDQIYAALSMSTDDCIEPRVGVTSRGCVYIGTLAFKSNKEAIEEIIDVASMFNLTEITEPVFGGVQFNLESPNISGRIMISRSAMANRLNKEEYHIGAYLMST